MPNPRLGEGFGWTTGGVLPLNLRTPCNQITDCVTSVLQNEIVGIGCAQPDGKLTLEHGFGDELTHAAQSLTQVHCATAFFGEFHPQITVIITISEDVITEK